MIHSGPGPVGMMSPTNPEIIQIIRAIMNALIQPILYRALSASNHTNPPIIGSQEAVAKNEVDYTINCRAYKSGSEGVFYSFFFTKESSYNVNYDCRNDHSYDKECDAP